MGHPFNLPAIQTQVDMYKSVNLIMHRSKKQYFITDETEKDDKGAKPGPLQSYFSQNLRDLLQEKRSRPGIVRALHLT